MIVPIYIDTSAISDQFHQLDKDSIDDICDNVAKTLAIRYAATLEQEAVHSLNQTRKRYIQAINVVDTGRMEGTVLLDFSKDPLVRMIEEGADAFDMKRGMLNSSKAKYTKDGRKYITIPFRFGVPTTIGDSDVFSSIMPDAVYEVVKEEPTLVNTAGGSRSTGLTVNQLPPQYQKPATRAAISDSKGKILFEAYTHKSSIYEGLMKFNDAVTGQNTYGSFRRVSESGVSASGAPIGSDPDSWIHKGIEQYNLVTKALNNFDQPTEVQVALNNEFEKLGLI